MAKAAPVLALVLCSAVLYGETLFGDRAFYARDVLHYYWPMRSAAAELIRHFELPQWAAFSQSGLPFLGDIHAAVLYPPHLLYQFLSFPRAYAWLLFVHHVAAGVGALVFFRRLGAGRGGALCGALVYMLSGYVAGLMNAGSLMAGAAYVPWILAVLADTLSAPRKITALGSLLALQSLTGDPQSVLFSALGCAIFLACNARRKSLSLAVLGAFALAGLIAAVQLVPAWYVLGESNRAAVDAHFFEAFALHPIRLLELFMPFPLGGYLTPQPFWAGFAVKGPGVWPFALSAYLGAAAATVVVLGVRRSWQAGFGATLFFVGVLLALGTHGPLASMLPLPPFRFFRYPEKYLLVASFGLAVLVSQSVERICAKEVSDERLTVVGTTLLLGIIGIGAVYLFDADAEAFVTGVLHAFSPRVKAPAALSTLRASVGRALAFGTIVWAMCLLMKSNKARVAMWALPAVIAADLFVPARSVVFTAPVEIFQTPPKLVSLLNEATPIRPFRYMRDFSYVRSFERGSEDSYLRLRAWELGTLKSNLGGAFRLEEVGGYAGGFSLHRWEALAVALYDSPAKLAAVFNGCLALEPMANGRYSRDTHLTRLAVDAAAGYAVYKNELCQPRLRSVSQVLSAQDLEEAVRLVASPKFDVKSQAVVEGGAKRAGEANLSEVTVETKRASAQVHASGEGALIVFATSYYPGWTALVDGRRAPLKTVNAATMGVEVDAGDHRVEFAFTDPGLKIGVLLSLLGMILAVGGAVAGSHFSPLRPRGG